MASGFTHESSIGTSVEWYTPAWVFEALGLSFDLDPCHPEGERLPWIPAAKVYTRADDGLSQPWEGRVWMNPPYQEPEGPCKPRCTKKKCQERGHCLDHFEPGTEHWLAKMHEHRHGIALLMARTDTGWFHDFVVNADATFFLEGRVKFIARNGEPPINPKTGKKQDSPGCGQILVAWGADCVEALEAMRRAELGAFGSLKGAR